MPDHPVSPLADTVPGADTGAAGDGATDPQAPTVHHEGMAPAAASFPEPLARGASLGRYVVLARLGEGGMGVVYAAYDPELDRRLAVKLLRADEAWDSGSSHGRERLLREGQAMARLAHPNVIAVHDVGTYEAQVFVAMEFVDGGTLRAWLEAGPRSWREIVAMFVQAGRGLAAAHAAGIVHRDFKPENVLVGKDGRARVLDFGLAHGASEAWPTPAAAAAAAPSARRSPLDTPLTEAGSLLGTPRYMAPEQFEGRRTDARGDQFSFCVALYEALYGELPFEGDDLHTLSSNVRAGKLRVARSRRVVPAWVRAALARGLRARPEDRHPSMNALIAALQAAPAIARRRPPAGAGVALGVAAAVGGVLTVRAHRPPLCPSAEPLLSGVWDDARREEVRTAFRATRKPFAEDALHGVERALDEYASAWVSMHGEACTATRVQGEQSSELMDLRMACLNARRTELRALTTQFARADGAVVEKAFRAVDALEPLRDCADATALRSPARLPADPSMRARVEEVRQKLAEAHAAGYASRPLDALSMARDAVAEADRIGYGPLRAEALDAEGDLYVIDTQYKEAEGALSEAILAAVASRHESVETRAWIDLAMAYAKDVNAAGAEAARHAHACLERDGGGDDQRLARLLSIEGEIAYNADRPEEAIDLQQRAIALIEKRTPPDPELLAQALDRLSTARLDQYDNPDAIAASERSLSVRIAALGPQHPAVAISLQNLANAQTQGGKLDVAVENFRRALAIKVAAFGDDTISVANTTGNLALALLAQHHDDEALEAAQRALAIRLKRLDRDHPDIALSYGDLADVELDMGRYDDALDSSRKWLAIVEKDEGTDSPMLAPPLTEIGQALLGKRDARGALPYLERAVRLGEQRTAEPDKFADTRATLAHALLLTHGDLERARRLATLGARSSRRIRRRTQSASRASTPTSRRRDEPPLPASSQSRGSRGGPRSPCASRRCLGM